MMQSLVQYTGGCCQQRSPHCQDQIPSIQRNITKKIQRLSNKIASTHRKVMHKPSYILYGFGNFAAVTNPNTLIIEDKTMNVLIPSNMYNSNRLAYESLYLIYCLGSNFCSIFAFSLHLSQQQI